MHFITDVGEYVIKELIIFPGPSKFIPSSRFITGFYRV